MSIRRWLYRLRPVHEQRMMLLALAGGLPAAAIAIVLLWTGNFATRTRWTLAGLLLLVLWAFSSAVRERVASPLRTLSSLLEAMREGDYSIRARRARGEDALGGVMVQVNAMAATLRAQRLGALEATTLLRKVMEEIDVAVFAFDGDRRLRLVNRAGERLLACPVERMLNDTAESLGLQEYLEGDEMQTVQRTFPSGPGRWGIHRSGFREGGLPHQLLVVTDLTRALREEELQAWQRLVRVLGHELNNSLAPIKSIAGSLDSLIRRNTNGGATEWREDALHGLSIIGSRSESLSRFMGAYARLAKLPRPQLAPMDVREWVRHVASLEPRMHVEVSPGPELRIQGDRDQLEQLLINLVRNGADAALETGGCVFVSWRRTGPHIEVSVEDEGPGLSNTSNLFVPFFTTKPGGSGIGLVLSRQIAEAHGGSLDLRNRVPGPGCEARLVLPG
ncbi:MAG: PAS domain-containing sensor histidine kinase [Bryobacterales bacterium]|nr:PAS domain-containing sensor histidine kinase [Bryobacterales bacterium]MBV9400903.1 PAS domain-containing sensor histidine kinase [Bryobacterales bacterium]